jgi:lantibiotic biosynthesis protein
MARRLFDAQCEGGMLARIPLLPARLAGNAAIAGDPVLAEGIFLTSRQAAAAADRGGPFPDPGGRLAATQRGYEIRARFRPTPNGVFAGACRAGVSHEAVSLSLGAGHRARTIPAAGWLAAVRARVLDDRAALPLLTFTASNLITRRGQRLETERQAVPGEAGPQQVSVRATDATTLIMEVCRAGAALSDIHQAVTRQWPSVPGPVISATVLSLARAGFLLTDLLPDDLSRDPVGHLLRRIPGSSPLREPLSGVRCQLREADQHPPGRPPRLAALSAARDLADSVSLQDRPLAVDVAADGRISIPAALADEAAEAAGILWQTGPSRDPLTGLKTAISSPPTCCSHLTARS